MTNDLGITKGFEGVDERLKEREAAFRNKARRVWIRPNTSVNLAFCDDSAYSWDEHSLFIDGDTVHVRCVGPQNGCVICLDEVAAQRKTRSKITCFTVIDTTEWKDKQGNVHVNEKRLYAVKDEVARALKDFYQRAGGLKGKLVTVSRMGPTDFSSGSSFSLAIDGGQIVQFEWGKIKDNTPFDYNELAKPTSPEVMKAMLVKSKSSQQSAKAVDNSATGAAQSKPDMDQIPF